MLKVHVWLPHGSMVGHASISFGTTYISFWPADDAGKKDLKIKRRRPGHFMQALEFDIESEGNRRPITVTISDANTSALEDYVVSLMENIPQYQLAKFNCSNVVADCLRVACAKEPSFKPNAGAYGKLARTLGGGIWTPHEVLRYAKELAETENA